MLTLLACLAVAMAIDGIDPAKVDPCPNCGAPVRRFGSAPEPWWCADCLQAKTSAAAASLTSVPAEPRSE